jgi:tripartite-type tricarboxylate transporter receptor subunit TctC
MGVARRRFLQLAASAALLSAAPAVAQAQGGYPARPVRVIVGQAAGSSSDITARLIAQFLSDKLGQQFVVETRPGAAGNIATEAVTHMPPDGYSLLLVNAQNTINAALYDKLNFDFLRDIVPVGGIDFVPLVMEVHPAVPANTVAEFIAYAKANPGKINMASAGTGGPQHVAGELFKSMAGVEMTHVPYRGSTPAVTDMLGGQVQVMFDVTPTALPQIKAGKLRALGATTAKRLDALPDLPTIGETVKGYEASLDRHRRAEGHAAGHHRDPQQGDQRGDRRPHHPEAPDRSRRLADAADDAGRVRKDDGRRPRQMGQGHQGGQHQA